MKYRTIATAVCLGFFLCIQAAICAGQGRITKAELGGSITDKYEIVHPTTEFNPDTPKIYCGWKAEGLKPGSAVRGAWIAEDVGKAAPANFKIDEAAFNAPGANAAGSFALSKPNKGFPAGKYRLEIYVGNNLLKTVLFTVKAK